MATAAAALTGCGLVGGPGAVDYTQVQLHPSGDRGAWLDPGYAGGVGDHWTVPGTACGAGGGVLAVSDAGQDVVVGYDIRTGDEVWRVAETTCAPDDAAAGHLLVSRWGADGFEVVDVDVATGSTHVLARPDRAVLESEAIGRTDETSYVQLRQSDAWSVLAFAADSMPLWEHSLTDAHDCHLIAAHVVCEMATGPYVVLDAGTGEVTVSDSELTGTDKTLWTAGGFTTIDLTSSLGSGSTTVHDYTGAEIGTVVGADLPLNPNIDDGVSYAVDDLGVDGVAHLSLTDAEGWGVAHWNDGLRLSALNVPLPSTVLLRTAGADGSTVLYTDLSARTATLVATDGAELHTFEDVGARGLDVLEGLVVISQRDASGGTTVYLPAG